MSIFKRGKHAAAEQREPVNLSEASAAQISNALDAELEVDFVAYNPEDAQIRSFYHPGEWDGEKQDEGEKPDNPFEEELDRVLGEVKDLLLEKNASYGDAALNPVRIMSGSDAAEQIKVRMDDKLSRLYRGFAFEDTETGNPEDTLKDLVGYYFLLKIAEARNA